MKMNKKELISEIADQTGLKQKDVKTALEGFLSVVERTLQNEGKVQLVGFGSFETKIRAEYMGMNPRTGQTLIVPKTRIPVFKPGKKLKEALNH